MGEMAAAAVLMQSNIKFNGALILQMIGDGPVKLAVAEAQPDLSFRVTAKVVGEVADERARLEALLNVHGQGRCAITLDPQDKLPGQQPYQGVVPLHGDRREPLQKLSEVLEHYMLQSEQLDTRLVLAADDKVAAGLLIQRLPVEGEGNLGSDDEHDIGLNEGFNRIAQLSATLTRDELLGLDVETLLRRLYWQERLIAPRRRRWRPRGEAALCLHLLARTRRTDAEGARTRGDRRHRRRAGPGRGRMRVLRREVPLRSGRRRRDVHRAARPAAGAAAGAVASSRSQEGWPQRSQTLCQRTAGSGCGAPCASTPRAWRNAASALSRRWDACPVTIEKATRARCSARRSSASTGSRTCGAVALQAVRAPGQVERRERASGRSVAARCERARLQAAQSPNTISL